MIQVFVDSYLCKWGSFYYTHNFQCKLQSPNIWEVQGAVQIPIIGLGTLVFSQRILLLFSVTVQQVTKGVFSLVSLQASNMHFFYILGPELRASLIDPSAGTSWL